MKVFLSYASEDREIAGDIAESLRHAGHDVYPSRNWPKDLGAALRRAEGFVVLLSPASVGSPYVNEEIKLALVAEHLAGQVVPLVLTPSTQVPWILTTMQPIAVKSNPRLAADLVKRRLQGQGAAESGAR